MKNSINNRVFLGGTCNGCTWRERLIPMLKCDYFNPVVPVWNAEAQAEEIRQREERAICLYVITPEQTGFMSIAELVHDSFTKPESTVFCYIHDGLDYEKGQEASLEGVGKMIRKNGAKFLRSLEEVAEYVNTILC